MTLLKRMVINKILIPILLIFISGCDNFYRPPLVITSEQKINLDNNYKIKGLYDHIPEVAKLSTKGQTLTLPPKPKCKHVRQVLYAIILGNKADYLVNFNKTISDSVLYTTNYYNDSNFIIDTHNLEMSFFSNEKCNKYYPDKLPIPFFENYDFGLGKKETITKQLKGEPRPRYHTIYNVPNDLKVYVLAAQAGNFWKFDCKENRPESLGKWKHGYSKGVAVSDKYDRVVFWVIVW